MSKYYSLDGQIVSTNANLFNAVKALLPSASDPRVFDNGDSSFQIGESTDLEGNAMLVFNIRFNLTDRPDAESIFNSLKGLSGMFNQCLKGTFIGYHICKNYTNPPEPCNYEELYRSRWNGNSETVSHIINGVEQ